MTKTFCLKHKKTMEKQDCLAINCQNINHKKGNSFCIKDNLTEREYEILNYLCEGMGRVEIAERLFISPSTVKTHLNQLFLKAQVNLQHALVAKAFKEGWV